MQRRHSHWPFRGLVLLCVIALLVRIPSCLTPLWDIDEAVSACAANAILEGGIPYRDAIDHRGPITYYAYALIFFLFGSNNMVAVHGALLVLIACVGGVLYASGVILANKASGLLAAFVFFIFSFGLFGGRYLLAAHTEYAVILFSTPGAYCLIRYLFRAKRWWLLVVSGACYGMAFFGKQPALVDAFAVFCFLIALAILGRLRWKAVLYQLGLLSAGFAGVCLGVVGFFFVRGGLQDFVFYFWTYNTDFYIIHAGAGVRWKIYHDFFNYLFRYFAPFALFFVAGTIFVITQFLQHGRRKEAKPRDAQILYVLWAFGALMVPVVSGRIPTFPHYYIQAFPPMALVIGIAMNGVIAMLVSWFRRCLADRTQRAHVMLAGSSLFLCALILAVPVFSIYAERFSRSLPGNTGNPFEQETVQYIQTHTTSEDSIFVWGFYPELYVLANRHPASRYTFTNVLTGFIPWIGMDTDDETSATIVPGAWDILMQELQTKQPALIIDTSPGQYRGYGKYPPQKFPRLHQFLNQHYDVAHEVISETGLVALRIFKYRGGL